MSLPRPTGLKPPSKIGKPTGLPQPKASGPDLPPPPPDDDFIVGDRVWVSGTKPGFIAFIGETQFAAGDWAGVVLDRPEGKNDGSVQGVRYFQCEPKRGVFAKISKLSRTPGIVSSTPKPEDGVSESAPSSVRTANGNMSQTLPQARPTTPKLSTTRALSTSSSSLNKGSPPTSSLNLASKAKPATGLGKQLRLGDRVLVSGTKTGTLRYIGTTDFAKGDWAGVELDEKQGKNNGSVAGKRYFECQPMYGLFAPVHKVAKLASGSGPAHSMTASTPSPQTRSLVNTGLRLSRERSGSQESVSSISSTASSVSRSRAKTSSRPSTLNLTATTQALQKALKEKEEHIEQLLRERDLERAEVARAAAQVDEAEGQLTAMKVEHDRQRDESDDTLTKLKSLVHSLEQEKADLTCKLEDEKRKVEDLQFQIEEEAITKDDLENRTEEEEARLRDLERDLKREKERAEKFEQEFYTVKAMLSDKTERLESTEEMNTTYLDQIEELTHKLSQAEGAVKNYEATRLEEGARSSQVGIELVEKSNRVNELEEVLLLRDREVKDLQERIHEVEEELNSSKTKKNKMQETIENLSSQLKGRDEASNNLTSEIQNLKSQLSDLQRRLDASNDNNEHLMEEKCHLEQQMSEMMKNSGDSSNKLSMLNDQLQEKNRKVQDLQAALSNSTQQLGKLNDEIENLKQATLRERENLALQNDEISQNYQSQLEDLQKELSKANNKMQQMTENHKKETDDSLGRKIREIEELKKQLQQSIEEQEKQEVQTQAHKQVLEKITMEKEALQFEKDKAEKQVKRLETEKESLHTDLVHVRAEVNQVQAECEKVKAANAQLQENLQDVKTELKKSQSSKDEIQKQMTEVTTERDAVKEERDGIKRDTMETKVAMQQKELLIEELQKEVEKMKSEVQNNQEKIMQMSQDESVTQKLQTQLDEVQRHNEEQQKSLNELESERDSMRAQLEFSNLVAEEKRRLEDQNHQMAVDAEREAESHRKEKEELERSNTTLREEMDSMRSQIQLKGSELDSLKQQIANLKNENVSLESYRSSVQKMEKERTELNDKIIRLEASLTESKTISPNMNSIAAGDTTAVAVLQEEKTGLQGQVDFLNSVIIDLQQKNKDLNHKVEILESGVITNGDHDSSIETEPPKSRAPPRLFCDICDVFDKHDTDDCPLQAMDYDEEGPSPTHYHGDRKASRPYCDICEEFHDPCSPSERPECIPDIVLTPPHQNSSLAEHQNGSCGEHQNGSWGEWEPKVRYHSGSQTVQIGDIDYSACSIFEDEDLTTDHAQLESGHTQDILSASVVSSASSKGLYGEEENVNQNAESTKEYHEHPETDYPPTSDHAEDIIDSSPETNMAQNQIDNSEEIKLTDVVNELKGEDTTSDVDNEKSDVNDQEQVNVHEVKENDEFKDEDDSKCPFKNTTDIVDETKGNLEENDNLDESASYSSKDPAVIDQEEDDETTEEEEKSKRSDLEVDIEEDAKRSDDENEEEIENKLEEDMKDQEEEEEEEEEVEEEEEEEWNETNIKKNCDMNIESHNLQERLEDVNGDFQSLGVVDEKYDERNEREDEIESDERKLGNCKEGEVKVNENDGLFDKSGLGWEVEGNVKGKDELTDESCDVDPVLYSNQDGEVEVLHDSAISIEDDCRQEETECLTENKSDFSVNVRSSNRDSGIMTDSMNVVDTGIFHEIPDEERGHVVDDTLPRTAVDLHSNGEDTDSRDNVEESGTSVDNNDLVPQTPNKMEDSCRVS